MGSCLPHLRWGDTKGSASHANPTSRFMLLLLSPPGASVGDLLGNRVEDVDIEELTDEFGDEFDYELDDEFEEDELESYSKGTGESPAE